MSVYLLMHQCLIFRKVVVCSFVNVHFVSIIRIPWSSVCLFVRPSKVNCHKSYNCCLFICKRRFLWGVVLIFLRFCDELPVYLLVHWSLTFAKVVGVFCLNVISIYNELSICLTVNQMLIIGKVAIVCSFKKVVCFSIHYNLYNSSWFFCVHL